MTKLLGIGAALGALAGLGWWAAYEPRAYSLALLVGGHALAGLGWAGLCAALKQDIRALVIGLVMGLVIGPAALAPVHQAGLLGGPSGAVVDLVVLAVAVLTGLRWWSGLGAVAALTGLALFGQQAIPDAQLATARHQPDFYTTGPAAIIGIDGADWQVLDPLMAQGDLPHLATLMERGQHGVLWSSEPMASPVVWTTIFTGHTPSTHGLEDWNRSDARSRKVPALWDIFEVHQKPGVVVNVPGSWPPSPLKDGSMLSGFPIPGVGSGDTGHLSGRVLEQGAQTVALAAPVVQASLSNQIIDTLAREKLLPTDGYAPVWTLEGRTLSGQDIPTLTLEPGEHSDWLSLPYEDVRVKFIGLQDGVLVTPAFQSPTTPRHAFSANVDPGLLEGEVPYVVEGIGWTAHRDARLAAVVPGLLLETQERQLQAAEALLRGRTPDLFGFVFTATDRIQHAYWSLHEPQAYEGVWSPPPSLEGQDYVVDAYRAADEALGRLLKLLPGNVTVFVVSDHGVSAEDPKHRTELGEAGHRAEGIWIAAGPAIDADAQPRDMRVVDVAPTLLYCVGAPVAKDFDGHALPICGSEVATVDTYMGTAGSGGVVVDDSQEDQIKALGYMDEADDE